VTIVERLRDDLCDNASEEWCAKIDALIDAAEKEGGAKVLANPISRGTLYVNADGYDELPDGQYPIVTVLVPKEEV
jgi:hypothetical protein